jgi:hypothetical protein
MPFEPVVKVAEMMEGYAHPWFVAGSWATDLALGRETRLHGTVEIAVFRDEHATLREWLAGWKLTADLGYVKVTWEPGESLSPAVTTVTGRRPDGDPSALNIRIENTGHGQWFGSGRQVSHPLPTFGRTSAGGIPHVAPAISLLMRAPEPAPLDHQDFRLAVMTMPALDRLWLDRALSIAYPDHPWREAFAPPPAPPEPDVEEE